MLILQPDGSPIPKAESIALGWILHGLDQWRRVSEAPPTVRLPSRSLPAARQCVLVLCPAAGPPQALLEHQPTVNERVVVLGTLDQVRTLAGFLGRPCHYYRVGFNIVIAVQQGVLLQNSLRDRHIMED